MSYTAVHRTFNAIFLIAISALSPWAYAQNSYKCGSTYSQTPCPEAVPVAADDSRSNVQKKQTDAATARIAKTADTMEKDRLSQEKRDLAANRGITVTPDRTALSSDVPDKTSANKKKKAPEYFTAQVPGEKKAKEKAKEKVKTKAAKEKAAKEKTAKAAGTTKAKKETASKS